MSALTAISATISEFWAYKPDKDDSAAVKPQILFDEFSVCGNESHSVSISVFSTILTCPYRVLNRAAGVHSRLSRKTIDSMSKGTAAHREAELQIRQRAADSLGRGGPPDVSRASEDVIAIAEQDLLEAPEATVKLAAEGIRLRGKADGLLRSNGLIVAVERKPRTRMYQRSSALQAMTCAIGGCLSLGQASASLGASWLVTSYAGVVGPQGRISEKTCQLIKRLANAYGHLIEFGASGESFPGLPGPGPEKCRNCEFWHACAYRIDQRTGETARLTAPVWLKYAKRGRKQRKRPDET
jgi:hypothetical protein